MRKNFLPSEAVEIVKILEPMEKKEAKERQGTRTDLQLVGKFPTSKKVQTRDKLGQAVGMSGRTKYNGTYYYFLDCLWYWCCFYC